MELIWISLIISLVIQFVLFIPAFIFKTDKLTDLSYSLTFALLSVVLFLSSVGSILHLVLLIMLLLWSFRLGIYLFIRINKMKRDKRFDGVREDFFKFLRFWILQGVVVWVVLISSIIYFSKDIISLNYITIIGLFFFLSGLFIETISDYQKFVFKSNSSNKNNFITSGLWKYSRHPNFFGESLIWIGVFIYTMSSYSQNSWFGIISPLFILLILLFGTGIPPLEKSYNKRFGKRKDYKDYKRKTNKFVMWFPRK